MPNRDKTGPSGEGEKTGRGKGPCGTDKTDETTEKQLDNQRGTGRGPFGNGKPRGGAGKGNGQGRAGRGRRKDENGITYF